MKKKFISMLEPNIFIQIFTLTKANEDWLKLHELHDNSSNVCEKKIFSTY